MTPKDTAATLDIAERGDLAPGARVLSVDCAHATTTITVVPGPLPVADALLVRVALVKHFAEEGCRCTKALRQRYGIAPAQSERGGDQ